MYGHALRVEERLAAWAGALVAAAPLHAAGAQGGAAAEGPALRAGGAMAAAARQAGEVLAGVMRAGEPPAEQPCPGGAAQAGGPVAGASWGAGASPAGPRPASPLMGPKAGLARRRLREGQALGGRGLVGQPQGQRLRVRGGRRPQVSSWAPSQHQQRVRCPRKSALRLTGARLSPSRQRA